MSAAPLSIVVPTYNHAHYLPRALDAVLAQSVPPRELIVIDDASTDNTPAILEKYARKHSIIRALRNERNLGVVGTLNRGSELSTCEFLGFHASDDYILPGMYEKFLALLTRHPKAGFCSAYDSYQIGLDGPVVSKAGGWSEQAGYFTPAEICRQLRHSIAGHAVMFRRSALQAIRWFDPDLAWYCDWFAHLVIAFRHGACHVPETLGVRVFLPGNYSADAKSGTRNTAVLGHLLDRITQPEFADVAPFFRRNGAATNLGTDLVRAAAARPDCWSHEILGLLNGFTPDQYLDLLTDPNPIVRKLAEVFLPPHCGQAAARRAESEGEVHQLRAELDVARSQLPPGGVSGKLRWVASLGLGRLRRMVSR